MKFTLINEFTIHTEPRPQGRPRFSIRGGRVHVFDPSAKEKKMFMARCLKYKPSKPTECAMFVDMNLYFARPKSHYGTGKNSSILKNSAPEFHVKTPDTDNLVKFIFDALNDIFWKDDAMIMGHKVKKHYASKPRVEVSIYTVTREELI